MKKLPKEQSKKLKVPRNRKDRLVTIKPFMLTPSDPKAAKKLAKAFKKQGASGTSSAYGWTWLGQSNRSKSIKVLTKRKRSHIIELVKKLKRKDNKMAHDKKKNNKGNMVKTAAWLVEASFRGFVGWILLSNFDHIATTAAAFYALGTAAVIVVTHFYNASK